MVGAMVGVAGTEGLPLRGPVTLPVLAALKDRVRVAVAELLGVPLGVDWTLRLKVEE